MSVDFDPKAVYKQMSDDELADLTIDLKEQAAQLRQTIWSCEDELRNRLLERNAKRIQGERYLIKSSVKRDIKWDPDALNRAEIAASKEGGGRFDLFCKAFPWKRDAKIRELNELLKLGGETARLVEAAKLEVNEKVELAFEQLAS